MNSLAPHMQAAVDRAYAAGKLDPGVHYRLVQDLQRYATEIGITPEDITGENYHLTDFEIAYLKDFRRLRAQGKLGLVYVGAHDPSVFQRGKSICGALTRNFIESRFMPREELVEHLFKSRAELRYDLIVVPDFHYDDANAATRRALSSWLIGRMARGWQSVIGFPTQKVMQDAFGVEHVSHLKHFDVLTGYIQNAA